MSIQGYNQNGRKESFVITVVIKRQDIFIKI